MLGSSDLPQPSFDRFIYVRSKGDGEPGTPRPLRLQLPSRNREGQNREGPEVRVAGRLAPNRANNGTETPLGQVDHIENSYLIIVDSALSFLKDSTCFPPQSRTRQINRVNNSLPLWVVGDVQEMRTRRPVEGLTKDYFLSGGRSRNSMNLPRAEWVLFGRTNVKH